MAEFVKNGTAHQRRQKLLKAERNIREPEHFESGKRIDFHKLVVPTSAILTGALVGLAAPHLIETSGVLGSIKTILLGGAAAAVSGVVNHYAVTKGTELAATGFKLAGTASLIAIITVGASAFAFSYSGLVLSQVDKLKFDEHGHALATYVEDVGTYSSQLAQMRPIIASTAKDLQLKIECEVSNGCLSGTGSGKGAVYRGLLPPTQRAAEIVNQLAASEENRSSKLLAANQLIDRYREIAADPELTQAERMRKLSAQDSEIKQMAADIRQSAPMTLLQGYQSELASGLRVVGKPAGTDAVNSILKRHSETLRIALEDVSDDLSTSPAFPTKAGVAEAFSRFTHFWPIAVLTGAIELLIPFTLWIFFYLEIVWKKFKISKANERGGRAEFRIVQSDDDPRTPSSGSN